MKYIMLHIFGKVRCQFCKGWHRLESKAKEKDEEGNTVYYTSCGGWFFHKHPNLNTLK